MEIMELYLKPTYFSLPIFFSTSEGAFYNIVHIVVCLYLLTKSHSIYCKQYEIAPCSYLTDAIAILLQYYFQCSTQLIVPSLLKHKYGWSGMWKYFFEIHLKMNIYTKLLIQNNTHEWYMTYKQIACINLCSIKFTIGTYLT